MRGLAMHTSNGLGTPLCTRLLASQRLPSISNHQMPWRTGVTSTVHPKQDMLLFAIGNHMGIQQFVHPALLELQSPESAETRLVGPVGLLVSLADSRSGGLPLPGSHSGVCFPCQPASLDDLGRRPHRWACFSETETLRGQQQIESFSQWIYVGLRHPLSIIVPIPRRASFRSLGELPRQRFVRFDGAVALMAAALRSHISRSLKRSK